MTGTCTLDHKYTAMTTSDSPKYTSRLAFLRLFIFFFLIFFSSFSSLILCFLFRPYFFLLSCLLYLFLSLPCLSYFVLFFVVSFFLFYCCFLLSLSYLLFLSSFVFFLPCPTVSLFLVFPFSFFSAEV